MKRDHVPDSCLQPRHSSITPASMQASAAPLRRRFVSRNTAPPIRKVNTTLERRTTASIEIGLPGADSAWKNR